MTDPTPLDKLRDAVQEFANTVNDEPHVVTGALVVWEEAMTEDGDMLMRQRYADLSHASMSATLGLAVGGRRLIENEMFHHDHDEEDDG